jgi:hypothetical protein
MKAGNTQMGIENTRSRITLWFVEAIIAVNVLYLSGKPLLDAGAKGFSGKEVADQGVEALLTGDGPYSAAFWLRIVSIIAAIVILVSWPTKSAPKRMLEWRVRADFTLSILFFYIVCLSIIFGTFSNYLWIQPVVYAGIMAVAYVANSWWKNG